MFAIINSTDIPNAMCVLRKIIWNSEMCSKIFEFQVRVMIMMMVLGLGKLEKSFNWKLFSGEHFLITRADSFSEWERERSAFNSLQQRQPPHQRSLFVLLLPSTTRERWMYHELCLSISWHIECVRQLDVMRWCRRRKNFYQSFFVFSRSSILTGKR